MDTPWRIELLGRISARQDGVVLTRFRTQKTALLLARLALFPHRSHPREELADFLWPEAPWESARNNLKQSLSTLRRLIELPGMPAGSILIATRTAIQLNPAAFVTDVAEFKCAVSDGLQACGTAAGGVRLRQALSLYQGELLPSFYEEWVIEERAVLAALLEDAQAGLALAEVSPSGAVPAENLKAIPAPHGSAPPRDPLRLPLEFTRFFGRVSEKEEIERFIGEKQERLLTLTGPGGSGKTRLSLEAARLAAETFHNRVFFVPLADLADPALIFGAIADTLRLPRSSETEPLEQIAATLSSATALLVLDNLEQFAAESAPALLALLSRLPLLTIIATSRQRLYVAGERELPVAPLPVPASSEQTTQASPDTLRRFPSVLLFADRAQAARPDFQITVRNAEAIAEICRRLEGLPLALELAAAWTPLLTPAQMRDRLQERFSLLVSRSKDVSRRHQTLWAAIEWSCCLLPPDLARFWRRLSVFRGGFTTEAAADVCAEPQALDFLWQLRARSLVMLEETGETIRFRLLEMLREFGAAELPQEESASLFSRHADFFLRLAEEAEPHLTGPDQPAWLQRLAQEQENLRFVLREDCAGDDPGLRLRLAGALWRFWSIRGPLEEGRRLLEQALQHTGSLARTSAEARALNGLAILTRRQGDLGAAEAVQRRCLALWREVGDARGVASALNNLGTLVTLKGDFAAAEPLLSESLHLWRDLNQPLNVAQTLNNLGFLAQEQGEPELARCLCSESLEFFRSLGSPQGKTLSLTILASASVALEEYECAVPQCREVLEIAATLNDSQAVVTVLQLLAQIRLADGRPEDAARLLGSAARLRAQIGSFQDKRAHADAVRLAETVQRMLPARAFADAWAAGQALALEGAIDDALRICVPAEHLRDPELAFGVVVDADADLCKARL